MKLTILVIAMFVFALAAGLITGRLIWHQASSSSPPASSGPTPVAHAPTTAPASPLAQALQLTPEQTAQMRPIWQVARNTAVACLHDAQAIQKNHEEQLLAMLTDEQKARYAQLTQEDHERIAAADAKRQEAFRVAVERTRKILHPDQWRAYEQILKNEVGTVPDTTQPVSSSGWKFSYKVNTFQ
jgi:hypothetical protein